MSAPKPIAGRCIVRSLQKPEDPKGSSTAVANPDDSQSLGMTDRRKTPTHIDARADQNIRVIGICVCLCLFVMTVVTTLNRLWKSWWKGWKWIWNKRKSVENPKKSLNSRNGSLTTAARSRQRSSWSLRTSFSRLQIRDSADWAQPDVEVAHR